MSLSNRLGLLGRKVGMMRIFTDDGDAMPVTVLDVSNNRVTQVKTEETDGYSAIQVAFGARKASRVTKPQAGHLAKAGVEAGEILKEFRVDRRRGRRIQGWRTTVPVSAVRGRPEGRRARHVDRQGLHRHHQAPQLQVRSARRTATAVRTTCRARSRWRRIRAACSRARRCRATCGDETVTTQNLDIVRVDEARQLLLVRGAVPGSKNGHVVVRPAVKVKVKKGAN